MVLQWISRYAENLFFTNRGKDEGCFLKMFSLPRRRQKSLHKILDMFTYLDVKNNMPSTISRDFICMNIEFLFFEEVGNQPRK